MFGERMRQIRESLNLTQDELAERAGLEVLQIWRYESGKTKPNTEMIAKIAKGLQVSADYLLGLTDEPKGYVEIEITPQEQRVLEAYRRGDIRAIILLTPDKPPKSD